MVSHGPVLAQFFSLPSAFVWLCLRHLILFPSSTLVLASVEIIFLQFSLICSSYLVTVFVEIVLVLKQSQPKGFTLVLVGATRYIFSRSYSFTCLFSSRFIALSSIGPVLQKNTHYLRSVLQRKDMNMENYQYYLLLFSTSGSFSCSN